MEPSVKEAIYRIAKQVDVRKEFESRVVQAFGEQVLWEASGIYDEVWGWDYKSPPVEDIVETPAHPFSDSKKLWGQLKELARSLLAPKGLIFLGGVAITSFLFFWYEYRPSEIRAECSTQAYQIASRTMDARAKNQPWQYKERAEEGLVLTGDVEFAYISCLRRYGLEPSPQK